MVQRQRRCSVAGAAATLPSGITPSTIMSPSRRTAGSRTEIRLAPAHHWRHITTSWSRASPDDHVNNFNCTAGGLDRARLHRSGRTAAVCRRWIGRLVAPAFVERQLSHPTSTRLLPRTCLERLGERRRRARFARRKQASTHGLPRLARVVQGGSPEKAAALSPLPQGGSAASGGPAARRAASCRPSGSPIRMSVSPSSGLFGGRRSGRRRRNGQTGERSGRVASSARPVPCVQRS